MHSAYTLTRTPPFHFCFCDYRLLELSDHMGLVTMRTRFMDPYMAQSFAGLFPKNNPRDTRFAINFYSSIGLGPLTYVRSLLLLPLRCVALGVCPCRPNHPLTSVCPWFGCLLQG